MIKSKKRVIMIMLSFVFLMASCKVSKTYQGEWYALNGINEQVKLDFTEKELTTDQEERFNLSQTGQGFENRMIYYQIKLDEERYTLIYPDKSNKEEAVVIAPADFDSPLQGKIVFKMNRKAYPTE